MLAEVSAEAGFGKSLFERLSLLGHHRHLLDTQYRMHPNISSFPNTKFYQNRINDSQIVKSDTYKKCYIPGPFYGTYSFLNISCGREVLSDHNSWKNVVEIAVLLKNSAVAPQSFRPLYPKEHRCFFNADEDKDLQTVIMEVKKDQDQPDDTFYLDRTFMSRGGSRNITGKAHLFKLMQQLENSTPHFILSYFLFVDAQSTSFCKVGTKICCSFHYH